MRTDLIRGETRILTKIAKLQHTDLVCLCLWLLWVGFWTILARLAQKASHWGKRHGWSCNPPERPDLRYQAHQSINALAVSVHRISGIWQKRLQIKARFLSPSWPCHLINEKLVPSLSRPSFLVPWPIGNDMGRSGSFKVGFFQCGYCGYFQLVFVNRLGSMCDSHRTTCPEFAWQIKKIKRAEVYGCAWPILPKSPLNKQKPI